MALIFFDIAASILQSVLFTYTLSYCDDKNRKDNRLKLFFIIIVFIIDAQLFTRVFGNSGTMAIFATHIVGLAITIVFYRKNILNGIVSYTIIYSIIILMSIVFGSLIFEYVRGLFSSKYIIYETIFLIYVPQSLLLLLCFKHMDKIEQIHKLIINEGFSVIFLIMSFFLDFILTFYLITLGQKSQLLKNIIYIIFFVFLIILSIYFWKIHQKSQQYIN